VPGGRRPLRRPKLLDPRLVVLARAGVVGQPGEGEAQVARWRDRRGDVPGPLLRGVHQVYDLSPAEVPEAEPEVQWRADHHHDVRA
jgi:hypothetical protein